MKSVKTLNALCLFALLVFPLFFSCQEIPDEEESTVWTLVTSGVGWYSEEKWEISEDTIIYSTRYAEDGDFTVGYQGTIVSSVTGSFNAGDTGIITGELTPAGASGYYVICYTAVENAGWGEIGKYNVFRWQTNETDTSAMDFTVGTYVTGTYPDTINQVFDTAAAAESGATNTAGYFAYFSEGAERD